VASDEAHAWARNLRLKNPIGKLALTMLSGYVNGDGVCYVGQHSLAYDCDLSLETVRKKLIWLDKIGAIARSPRWLDANGVRNGDGRGKRTTDDIKLLLFADIDLIEKLAELTEDELVAHLSDRKKACVSPPADEGANSNSSPQAAGGLNKAVPTPAPHQPPSCMGGQESNLERELESPPTPSGGESDDRDQGLQEDEAERVSDEPLHFAPAWQAFPGHEAMRRDLALSEFRQLSEEKQRLCRAAVPLFAQMLTKLGRTRVPNFHLWIRSRGFEEFPHAKLHQPGEERSASAFETGSREGQALLVLHQVARVQPFVSRGSIFYPGEVTPQVLAFANAEPSSAWLWIEDVNQIAAWSSFIASRVRIARPPMEITRGLGEAQRRGIYAPWHYPPRKDGTIWQPEKNGGEA